MRVGLLSHGAVCDMMVRLSFVPAAGEVQREAEQHRARLLDWARRSAEVEALGKVAWKWDALRDVPSTDKWTD